MKPGAHSWKHHSPLNLIGLPRSLFHENRKIIRGALILALLGLSACAQKRSLSITFGGDVMLARDGIPLYLNDLWGDFSQAGKADSLFFVNLESPLTEKDWTEPLNKGYSLCASAEQAVWLEQGGVSLVSTENNHKFDCGDTNGDQNYRILSSKKISVVGGIRNPVIYESNHVKVGVIAVDAITQNLQQDDLIKKVNDLRPNCDILVVSIHWGNEYQTGADELQNELARLLADSGVDVLWGHHPHVLQKIKIIHSEKTGKDMLSMFSLGNLLSDQWMNDNALRSALVTANFQDGKLVDLKITPVRMDRATRRLVTPDSYDVQKYLKVWG
jgi:poly-gamma-glutamate synthesis protein (capsule biosynthesis protein)